MQINNTAISNSMYTKPAAPALSRPDPSKVDTLQSPASTLTKPTSDMVSDRPGDIINRPEPRPMSPQDLLNGIAKTWGTAEAQFDFTGDGTVDVSDLLHVITNWEKFNNAYNNAVAQPKPASVPLPEPTSTDAVKVTKEQLIASTSEVDASVVADQATPAADVAGTTVADTVDTSTPIASTLIPSLASSKSEARGLNGAAARAALSAAGAPSNAATRSLGGLRTLTNALLDNLAKAGFENQPPTNIRELVDSLNLSPKQSEHMLKHVAQRYPEGLGVSMVA